MTTSWFDSILTTMSGGLTQAGEALSSASGVVANTISQLPSVSLPDVSLPTLSDVGLQDVTFPEVSLPEVSFPEVSFPDVSLPDTGDAKNFFEGIYVGFTDFVGGSNAATTTNDTTKEEFPSADMPVTDSPQKKRSKKMVKLLLLGDECTGKSSLLNWWIHKKFNPAYRTTIGADFMANEVVLDDFNVTVQVWDTAGQQRFQSLGVGFYRGSDACILIADVSKVSTVDHLSTWRDEFLNQANPIEPKKFPFLVIANKNDLNPEEGSISKLEEWCSNFDYPCFFTSVKTGTPSVDEAFLAAVKKAIQNELLK